MSLLIYHILLVVSQFSHVSEDSTSLKMDKYRLTVSFTNAKKDWYGKKMYMAAWKKGSNGFPEVGTQDEYQTFWLKSEKKSGTFQLEKGAYAVSCYLDLNGNKKLDYNMWGAPKEPYCFSNNFTPIFSAPDFSDCSFYLSQDKEIQLKLIY